jgi:hypothetical protein
MGLTDPSADEPAILTYDHIIVRGARYQATLTARYVTLVDPDNPSAQKKIPLADIQHAHATGNSMYEPVIRLTVSAPTEMLRTVELIFARTYGTQNFWHRDRWMSALSENGIAISEDPVTARAARVTPSEGMEETLRGGDWIPSITPRKASNLPPEEKELVRQSPLQRLVMMIMLVIVILFSTSLYGQFLVAHMPPTEEQMVTPVVTYAPVPSVLPTPTPVATQTPLVPTGPTVPATGVWVLVNYTGNYSGEIGSQGSFLQVNASGSQFYPLAITGGIVDGSIDKQDGNARNMTVEVYQDGTLVSTNSITEPYGEIILHTQLSGSEATGAGLAPSSIVETVPTLEASLPPEQIPQTGIWFRVQYPGSYSGSIGSGGTIQQIDSNGTRFFQLFEVPSGSTVDGSIEKLDGSAANLVIELYKDGALLTRSNTSLPHGVVELHFPI